MAAAANSPGNRDPRRRTAAGTGSAAAGSRSQPAPPPTLPSSGPPSPPGNTVDAGNRPGQKRPAAAGRASPPDSNATPRHPKWDDADAVFESKPATAVPSWLVSVCVHIWLFAFLVISLPAPKPHLGPGDEPDRLVGLYAESSLSDENAEPAPLHEDPQTAEQMEPEQVTPIDPLTPPLEPLSERVTDPFAPAPLDLPSELEPVSSVIGSGPPVEASTPAPRAVVKSGQPKKTRTAAGTGGLGQATFFGASAQGNVICYVVDASGSMEDFGAMRMAKAELLASLERLKPTQQFQIIFYDNTPSPMTVVTGRQGLPKATAAVLEQARQFIRSSRPNRGTNHYDALTMAIDCRPDVIFLLTDADFPQLDRRDLEKIRQRNAGRTQIHTIEFGKGSDLATVDNFLKRLSRENGGQHLYRDVTRFEAQLAPGSDSSRSPASAGPKTGSP